MAHYAELDSENKVLRVLVLDNDWHWRKRMRFLKTVSSNRWVQTSYNNRIRGHFARKGDRYDPDLNLFISPRPFKSWKLNKKTGYWDAPVKCPKGNGPYKWDEEKERWQIMQS